MSMNTRSEKGDVARINKSGFYGVVVSDDVYNILKDSMEFSRLTGGAFDVTVLPLSELWRESAKSGQLPDEKALKIWKPLNR